MSGNLCYCKNREGKIAKRKVIQWIAAVAIMLVGKLLIDQFLIDQRVPWYSNDG